MGERWECLKFEVDCGVPKRIKGGDLETKNVLIGPMRFEVIEKLGELGWKMTGVTSTHHDPCENGFFFFAREIK